MNAALRVPFPPNTGATRFHRDRGPVFISLNRLICPHYPPAGLVHSLIHSLTHSAVSQIWTVTSFLSQVNSNGTRRHRLEEDLMLLNTMFREEFVLRFGSE
eukprot:GHVU01011757.1.p2 GENE.GHVU01011757.1~~GHVU01011757.1.p2  ORF type:complete len:101 (-),score=7.92 GHVU01011757.1:837-1139(-)